MGEVAQHVSFLVVSILIGVASMVLNVILVNALKVSEGKAAVEEAFSAEWKSRYEQLVEDIRKQANQPKHIAPLEPKPLVKRASSSAEIRRAFDRINAQYEAGPDQAAS